MPLQICKHKNNKLLLLRRLFLRASLSAHAVGGRIIMTARILFGDFMAAYKEVAESVGDIKHHQSVDLRLCPQRDDLVVTPDPIEEPEATNEGRW